MAPVQASRWAGALIAGGKSQRMGQDKLARLLPDGRRLIEIPALALRQTCGHCLLVASEPLPEHELAGFMPLADAQIESGPLAALVAALEWATVQPNIQWVLALAGDLPRINSSVLLQLQALATDHPNQAVVAVGKRGPEPLIAAYPVRFARAAREHLEAGKRALFRLLEAESWIPAPELESPGGDTISPYFNLNRPQDWEQFLALAHASKAP
jgi:molybdenum cofactor guanylyltransferase